MSQRTVKADSVGLWDTAKGQRAGSLASTCARGSPPLSELKLILRKYLLGPKLKMLIRTCPTKAV